MEIGEDLEVVDRDLGFARRERAKRELGLNPRNAIGL
jgi:hypothetical protein